MQDIHSIGGGGGRLFGGGGGGGGGGGDRRLRTQHHNQNQHHQALKCPRCESLNTKFCYYNNYNLSQPRHFCKNCRRYWTKGGVLRNVPVGGGCRKTKRSKPKSSSVDAPPRERKSNSHSSSESSSLTATTTAAAATEVASASSSTSASTLLNFPDSRFFNFPQNINPSFEPPLINQSSDGGEFFPEIGTFTSLMTSSSNDPSSLLGFNIADISGSAYRLQQQNHGPVLQNKSSITSTVPEDLKMQEMSAGFLDQAAQINLSSLQNRGENGGLGALDWQAGGESGDQALFDFTGTVDHGYWSQTQWTDNDHNLYLP